MTAQFLRQINLIVSDASGNGLDLSQFRIQFHTVQSDSETPNALVATVYNLSDATCSNIQKEFTQVSLQAGYKNGGTGVIFTGTIRQVIKGRISATDSYLQITGSDGDIPYNYGTVSAQLKAGTTASAQIAAVQKGMGIEAGYQNLPENSGALSRGKVLWGDGKGIMRDIAATTGTTWSIQNGKMQIVPLTGYIPGEAAVLNSSTGLIGIPEQTNGGINVRCLLNPRLKVGGLVQIANKDITPASRQLTNATLGLDQDAYNKLALIPNISADGFYRLYVVEHDGDSRGNEFYSNLVCLSVDPSAPPQKSVAAYGG